MLEKYIFRRRCAALDRIMKEEELDCMMVIPSSYMKYTTGYSVGGDERLLAAVFQPNQKPCIFANRLYELQVTDTPVEDYLYWSDGENAPELLAVELGARGMRSGIIAVDPNCPSRFLLPLMKALPDSKWVSAAPYIDHLRLYKDDSECRFLQEACVRADEALARTMSSGRDWIGATEEDLLARLVYEMTRLGIKHGAACVCAGKNAAVPHHHPDHTVIREGDCLLIDFGGDYENYHTDMTRNFYFGEPDEEYRRVYGILLSALQKGKEAAIEGNAMEDVDQAVRQYITEQGYGPYFIHRTGHGIGLDCHEGPSAMEGEKTMIEKGMAFSCEPGIYLPGKFGVRIEEELLMTDQGVKALHHYPLDLQIIK